MKPYLTPQNVIAAVSLLVALAALTWALGKDGASPSAPASTPAATGSAAAKPAGGLAAVDANGDGVVYQSGMHPWIVEDAPGQCPICGMDLVPVHVDDAGEPGTVRIDPTTQQNMGVRTAPVAVVALQQTVQTTGRFTADEQRAAVVSPKISGWVETLHVNYEGARVGKGQPLMELYSPELVSTQEEYLLALRNRERLAGTPGAAGADRLVQAARRRLAYWDISAAQIEALEQRGEPQKTLTLYAPASGTVTETRVTEGQQVRAGETLMRLANLSTLWLMADVFEQDLTWVRPGTEAVIELPYEPGRVLRGRVNYLYDELDPATRTVRARIAVPNPGLRLKPGMYATVRLHGGATEPYPVVPTEAVVRSGTRNVVILALGDGRFMPTDVRTGVEADGRVQVLSGLQGTEVVVTSAQFLIDSEARLASAVSAMMRGAPEVAPVSETPPITVPPARPTATAPATGTAATVQVTVGAEGFSPQQLPLKAGVPTRLVFTRQTERTCATEVAIPALGIAATPLPMNEPVAITVTPPRAGTFTFACAMDMIKGALVVEQ